MPKELAEAWDEVLFQARRLCYIPESNPMYQTTVKRLQEAKSRRDEIRARYERIKKEES